MFFFFSSRRRHTRSDRDWSSDVCSSDLVRVPVAAGGAFAAPDHLLAGHHVPAPQIPHVLPHLRHFAGELMANHDREAGEAGIEHVPFFVRLVEVHVRAAHAARPRPDEHLARPQFWVGHCFYGDAWPAPHAAARDRLPGGTLRVRDRVIRTRIPLCVQHKTLHTDAPLMEPQFDSKARTLTGFHCRRWSSWSP